MSRHLELSKIEEIDREILQERQIDFVTTNDGSLCVIVDF